MVTNKELGEQEFIRKHKHLNNGKKPKDIQLFAWRVGFNTGWNIGYKDSKKDCLNRVCEHCPTNGGKECEKSFDCWIRNSINDEWPNYEYMG